MASAIFIDYSKQTVLVMLINQKVLTFEQPVMPVKVVEEDPGKFAVETERKLLSSSKRDSSVFGSVEPFNINVTAPGKSRNRSLHGGTLSQQTFARSQGTNKSSAKSSEKKSLEKYAYKEQDPNLNHIIMELPFDVKVLEEVEKDLEKNPWQEQVEFLEMKMQENADKVGTGLQRGELTNNNYYIMARTEPHFGMITGYQYYLNKENFELDEPSDHWSKAV